MSSKNEFKYLLLILIIFIAGCVETDIFLPALPDMMQFFSVSEGAIQSLLTWNFVGICVSGPFYGPLSDAFGRKRPLLVALFLFLAGSLMTLFGNSFDQMLLGRILQGVGSGGCFTLGTAILFDAFQKDKAINAINNLNMMIPIIMAMAPMLGGYLNCHFGFRSNFLAIALIVILSLVACLSFFKETLPKEKWVPFQPSRIRKDFKRALSHLGFWQITVITSLLFAAYITFVAATSVLFVLEFGVSKAIFPFFQAAILGSWVAGSLLLKSRLAKWGHLKVKQAGVLCSTLGGVILGIVAFIAPSNPYWLTFGMMFYTFGANWLFGLYFPEGMELLPDIKGTTASLFTSIRLLISALVIGFASSLYNGTVYPLIGVVLASLILVLPTLIWYERRSRQLSNS